MKKKALSAIVAFGVLAASLSAMLFVNSDGKVGLLEENAKRTSSEIASDETVYLDDFLPVLSDASDTNTELRAEALKAYNLLNDERENVGLDSLSWSSNLESTSAVRSQECSVLFSHERPNGKQWYTVNSSIQGGENLAFGYDDAKSANDAWMASPTHKDNILYDEFESVAISVYKDDSGVCYWATEFGY